MLMLRPLVIYCAGSEKGRIWGATGGILLGNSDPNQLWNKARTLAAVVDYSTLFISLPPDPDLYAVGAGEGIHFMNVSVSSTALFVSRTDAGGGTDDDNPNVLYQPSVDEAISVEVPAPMEAPTPSQSSFAACVVGWPATYKCPIGFLWVPPLYTCQPCKAGFFFQQDRCSPCPVGSFSALHGSTACTACQVAREVGQSQCSTSHINSSSSGTSCSLGYEVRSVPGPCVQCLPGFAGKGCAVCPPGQYSNANGRTACSACQQPLVATQWGSTSCSTCPTGYVPSPQASTCQQCLSGMQYFWNTRPFPVCLNKTVLECGRGFYLQVRALWLLLAKLTWGAGWRDFGGQRVCGMPALRPARPAHAALPAGALPLG